MLRPGLTGWNMLPRPICAHGITSYTIGVLLWGESQVVIRHVSVRASSLGAGCLECGPLRVCCLLAADDDGGDILRGGGVVVDMGHGGLRLVSVDNTSYDYVVSIAMPKCHPIFF